MEILFASVDKICKILYDQNMESKKSDVAEIINKIKEHTNSTKKTEFNQDSEANSPPPPDHNQPKDSIISVEPQTEPVSTPAEPVSLTTATEKSQQSVASDCEENKDDFCFHGYDLGTDLEDFYFYRIHLLPGHLRNKSITLPEVLKNIGNYTIIIQAVAASGEIIEDLKDTLELEEHGLKMLVATRLGHRELVENLNLPETSLEICNTQQVLSNSDSGMIFLENSMDSSEEERDSTPEHDKDERKAVPEEKTSAPDMMISNLMKKTPTIRIRVEILDHLMRLASELVLVRNQQLKIINPEDDEARASTQRLDNITTEIQSQIMATRMQPIGNIFSKFNRIVRDLSLQLKKTIEITTTGDDVELDRTILENLADPLMHIVRNCCDHGIEDSRTRIKNKKPAKGHVTLRAFHEGGLVNIEIKDDGAGISLDGIKRKALKNDLRSRDELEHMSDKEILQLIFLPGFSTASSVTDISGRGVGMDVVKVSIEKLGGNIEIKSEINKGTQIFLRLPLTLAIIPCLIIECENQVFAIPQVNLEELITLNSHEEGHHLETLGSVEVYRIRDSLLPIIRLSEVLRKGHSKPEQFPDPSEKSPSAFDITYFVILKTGDKRFGLLVDNIVGTEEVVISPLHSALKDIHIYSGATVRGDGQVSLILDAFGISEYSGVAGMDDSNLSSSYSKPESKISNFKSDPLLIFSTNGKEQLAINQKDVQRVIKLPYSDLVFVGEHVTVPVDNTFTHVLFLDKYLPISEHNKPETIYLIIPKNFKIPIGIFATQISDSEAADMLNINNFYNQDGITGSSMIEGSLTYHLNINKFVKKCEKELITMAAEQQLNMIS